MDDSEFYVNDVVTLIRQRGWTEWLSKSDYLYLHNVHNYLKANPWLTMNFTMLHTYFGWGIKRFLNVVERWVLKDAVPEWLNFWTVEYCDWDTIKSLEIIKLSGWFIDTFRPWFEFLEDSQDDPIERSLDELYEWISFIGSREKFNDWFCLYDRGQNVIVWQIMAIKEYKEVQPIFLIVHPDYRNKGISKIIRLIFIKYYLGQFPELRTIRAVPQVCALDKVSPLFKRLDPSLKTKNWFILDAETVKTNFKKEIPDWVKIDLFR